MLVRNGDQSSLPHPAHFVQSRFEYSHIDIPDFHLIFNRIHDQVAGDGAVSG